MRREVQAVKYSFITYLWSKVDVFFVTQCIYPFGENFARASLSILKPLFHTANKTKGHKSQPLLKLIIILNYDGMSTYFCQHGDIYFLHQFPEP